MRSRGLLINNLSTFINDTEEKKDLIDFVQKNKFNDLTFYANNGVLPTYDLQLALLVSECRAIGVKKTGIAIGSTAEADRVFTFMDTFPGTIINTIWIEYEFWNNEPRDFSFTQSLAEYIRANCPRTIELGCYIGTANEAEMLSLSDLVDRIFVHRYTPNGSNTYDGIKTRLSYLGTSDKRVKILPLFSAESEYMGPWYTANGIRKAESAFTMAFNRDTSNREWKDNVSIAGFYIYGYTQLRDAFSNGVA